MSATNYATIVRSAAVLLGDFRRFSGRQMYMRVQVFINDARSLAPELNDRCISATEHARKCFADKPIDHECAKLREALLKIQAHAEKKQQRK